VPRLAPCLVPVLLALTLAIPGCDSPPAPASLPEWTSADHDRSEEVSRAAAGGAPAAKAGAGKGADPLLEATWSQQCAACHGPTGHGDGPTGPMVHAADLTRADWQATVTDEQLAKTIQTGKGKMPPFPELPPKIVAGLVGRIRASRGR